ncbi:cytochrome-c oxidase [Paenibacillus macerans]|uniref:cytochrome-c oxidase n=1 Tax=Paenibacillus macerans TaxID=44252 RepID=UPI002DB945CE|nr:cytochrome-c oxidase [Paenibacillus macerans]MEC0331199.1 cytochrome-c oxidase [Paenibacillus macerans]
MGIAYIRISVIYFVAGVLLGMYMSMGHAHELESVHAHVNLLGWASFALAGLIYVLFPEAGESLLSKIQFWTYSLGLPVMMISLAFLELGSEQFELLVAIGGMLVVLGVVLFAANVLLHVHPKASGGKQ